jgi:plasmid rolling circle replication initiator protein Rep
MAGNINEYMKCKACRADVENPHKHMLDAHKRTMAKLFVIVYKEVVEPQPITGTLKSLYNGSKIKEPDEEMYRSFEEATQIGLKEIDKRVRRYFIDAPG